MIQALIFAAFLPSLVSGFTAPHAFLVLGSKDGGEGLYHTSSIKQEVRVTPFQQLSENRESTSLALSNGFIEHLTTISTASSDLVVEASASPADTNLIDASTSSTITGLSPTTNIIVFILGLIPFLWATYEFWSRIAVGASFGTGADSIQIRPSNMRTIGKDGDRLKSRGQQVLGDDALIVAYVLFAVAIGSVSIAVYSVLSSPIPI